MAHENILVIGAGSPLTGHIIRHLNKEGYRVSLLTGEYRKTQKYPPVFERYDFPYTADALPEIFDSASPDVTLFLGAFDARFDWQNAEKEAVLYQSSVINIMSAYSAYGKGRFIYISSGIVFRPDGSLPSGEECIPDPACRKGVAVTEGEGICRRAAEINGLDLHIIRLGAFYNTEDTVHDLNDSISPLCLEYLRTGTSGFNEGTKITPLSLPDAAFSVVKLATAEKLAGLTYHIASERTYCLSEIREIVKDEASRAEFEAGKPVKADSPGIILPAALSCGNLPEEIKGGNMRDPEADIRAITAKLIREEAEKKAARSKKDLSKASSLLKALIPFAENATVFLILYFFVSKIADTAYFARIDIWLLYVLIFALAYGQYQAVFSAFLSTGGYLLSHMRLGEITDAFLDFGTYVWIAYLFIIGLAVGYQKDKLADKEEEYIENEEYMNHQITDIRVINESNVRVKDVFRTQLINQDNSIGKIYEITSTLDRSTEEEVLFKAAGVVSRIMGSKDIALYNTAGDGYAHLFSSTGAKALSGGRTIREEDMADVFEELNAGRPYINRKLKEDRPMMACAIRNGGHTENVIMVWTLPLEKMSFGQANILTVIAMLIKDNIIRANRMIEQKRASSEGNGNVPDREYFAGLLNTYRDAEKQGLAVFTLLRLEPCAEGMTEEETADAALKCIRHDDRLGPGEDGHLYLLLPNTPHENASFVIGKLEKAGVRASAVNDGGGV